MLRSLLTLWTAGAALAACSEQRLATAPYATSPVPLASAVKVWENNAAVYWAGVARNLVAANNSNAFQAIRGYAIVTVAQYNAAVAAERGSERGAHPSVHAAISSASVVALAYLYPGQASALHRAGSRGASNGRRFVAGRIVEDV